MSETEHSRAVARLRARAEHYRQLAMQERPGTFKYELYLEITTTLDREADADRDKEADRH